MNFKNLKQISFCIHLKIDAINFKWMIYKDTVNNYMASINFIDEIAKQKNSFFGQLIAHELIKVLFIELKALFKLPQLELMGFSCNDVSQNINTLDEQNLIIRHLDLPIKHLFGSSFTIVAQNIEDLEHILYFVGYKPLQLKKCVTPKIAKFKCWGEECSVILESKVFNKTTSDVEFGRDNKKKAKKNYIELKVSINDKVEKLYVELRLIKHITLKYNKVNHYIKDDDFEYNEFFIEFGLEILQMLLIQIPGITIKILNWRFVNLPLSEYLAIKVINNQHASLIFIPNLKTTLINVLTDTLVNSEDDSAASTPLLQSDYKIKVPVLRARINISSDEAMHLKVGDVLLFGKNVDKTYWLDFGSSLLAARLHSDVHLQVIAKGDTE